MLDLTRFRSHADIVENFRWAIPESYNIAATILGGREADDHTIALIHDRGDGVAETYSFRDLAVLTRQVATYLQSRGIVVGDRVGASVQQGAEVAAIHLAIYALGAIAVPMSLIYGVDTYRHIIADSGTRLVFASPGPAAHIRMLRDQLGDLEMLVIVGLDGDAPDAVGPEAYEGRERGAGEEVLGTALAPSRRSDLTYRATTAEDAAMLLYTSGTTGPPKGALHAHRILEAYLLTFSLFFDIEFDDSTVFWTPSDWAWVGGLLDILLPGLALGHPVVASVGRFSPDGAFELIARNGVTHVFLAPTALKMMAQVPDPAERYQLDLRVIASGGEAVAAELHAWADRQLGATINEFYGLTEVNHLAGSCARLWPSRPGSMGPAYPGRTVDVVDAAGIPTEPGVVGEIVVRPGDPTQMLRYWNNPEATAARYRDGWMLTGDLAFRDSDGYITFQGRDDDIITSAGYRIGPAEIEELLVEHPAVADAAVIAKPDPIRGSVVKAVVRSAAGVEIGEPLVTELQQLVRDRLGAYKYPREIEFVDELPKTVTGKLNRRLLSDLERERADT